MIFHDHKTGVFRWLVFAATLRDDTAKIGAKVVNKIWSYWVIYIYDFIWYGTITKDIVAGWIWSRPHVGFRISGMMRKDCGDPQIAIWHTTPKFTTFFSPNLGHPCVAFSWLTICTSEKMIPMMVFAPAWFGCTFWRSVCQAVPLGSLSSFTPTKWHQTFASGFFLGISRKKKAQ